MSEKTNSPYRILAQKYRPSLFSEVVGQDSLVRTVSNTIESNRLPNAWILTGIRGVGKTSIARIIARSLNCIGKDGKGVATVNPCGICDNCISISEDRHVDVIEMDAASRTGVADIREIIESVKYSPTSARYKVYIIDEVHMLSTAAFNALLKTLEEPPPHVKFVFATTEIRKLPITVLSRCQRFDLRRVSVNTLHSYFLEIAEKEKFKITSEALQIISVAADGSIRDGLSLLDQAMSGGSKEITNDIVKKMLGMADKNKVLDLFENLMQGSTSAALKNLNDQYEMGVEPSVVIQELLETIHWLTRLKVAPEVAEEFDTPENNKVKGLNLSSKLSIPILTRAWQIMLKGLEDARAAPNSLQAVEMVLIRLSHASKMPPPAELIKKLQKDQKNSNSNVSAQEILQNTDSHQETVHISNKRSENSNIPDTSLEYENKFISEGSEALKLDETPTDDNPSTFKDLVDLAKDKMEPRLNYWLINDVHLVHFKTGHIEIRLRDGSYENLVGELSQCLDDWTGKRWVIAISNKEGEPTLAQQQSSKEEAIYELASQNPIVKSVLDAFPGSKVKNVMNHNNESYKSGDKE